MEARTVETRTSLITFGEDGILRVVVKLNVSTALSDAADGLETAAKLVGNQRVPALIDIRNSGPIDRDARKAYATAELVSAQAMLVNSHFSRIVANMFIRFTLPRFPIKVFNIEAEAIDWLGEFLK
jgi:hypothetical protein